jgi:energy-coupling factor transporter transmembrane protein EcfT
MNWSSLFKATLLCYGVSCALPPLVKRLPPEISLPTAEPLMMAGAVLLVLSLFLLAKSGWRTFLLAFLLLLPLLAFHAFGVLTHQVVRPFTIADRVEAPDGSAAFYALHQPGMPDDSQVICIQRSVLSGCQVIDAWQSQQPCQPVLPAYVAVYMAGNIASVGTDASPLRSLRRKCG